ncbi:dephospho-CoA kinase [Xinfangfangia sp. CPCC 101601]|uniref:Dephospho-CoA kinase n=1 Tax=Pseudogemmobacter lacusdianii TaxID=3069608 RepID=A0ABU0VTY6_9RHOB|nr:dephospho-CoA kinase [Xinfangfangia sp. CPCC 101601]MDQ2065184.1 dephospho-CoA kinase [Xinfangfangia sp. CPCC 101601]
MSFVLGLTGSIGMGKSTTAQMFADAGIPVWDADATVHRLYAPGGAAALALAKALPQAMDANGGVDRAALKAMIAADPKVLEQLNSIVHPLVSADRARFLAESTAPIVLLDIPLLFEGGSDQLCDAVVVVTAPPEVQKARVLARNTMTLAMLETILARQMPDAEKRARADYIIQTTSLAEAAKAVEDVLADIRSKHA